AALIAVVAASTSGLAAPQQPPSAGQVVAFVNGDPITALDVTQRMRLLELTTHKAPSRQDTLEELVNEKIKLQQAKNQKIEITDEQVDKVFSSMAQRT